jgi:hypothetical protein
MFACCLAAATERMIMQDPASMTTLCLCQVSFSRPDAYLCNTLEISV